jgi:sulfonate transport system substrate-binding protein
MDTMKRSNFLKGLLSVSAMSLWGERAAKAANPTVIRIGVPGVGVGDRPKTGGSPPSTVGLRGLLEEEFKKDGITVQWSYLRGAGPAVNELFANDLVDFGFGLGDLPSIIGRAGGLSTRVLLAGGIRQNTYLSVTADSQIGSVKDLRGQKVAVFKGTNIQLAVNRILEANGLTEKDLRSINMNTPATKAALVTRDVQAAFGGSDYLALRDQGVTKVAFTTRGGNPGFLRHSSVVGAQSFIDKYPQVTQRIVNVVVGAAKWLSDQDAAPTPVFQLWTKSGVQFNDYKEDFTGSSLKLRSSPLIDEYFSSQYKRSIVDAKRYGLIRKEFSFDAWAETKFLREALRAQNLESYWTPHGADGKPKA